MQAPTFFFSADSIDLQLFPVLSRGAEAEVLSTEFLVVWSCLSNLYFLNFEEKLKPGNPGI